MSADRKRRCAWVDIANPAYVGYHDQEWGIPVHQDRHHFELLILEGAQAGLSWATILNKRSAYRSAYAGFDPAKVARFTKTKQRQLLADAGIVRNRLKVAASISNACCFLKICEKFGSFDKYIWKFVDGQPLQGNWRNAEEIPAETPLSRAMSKELRSYGFKFVGPIICYSYMQAAGLVNDHEIKCFRHRECAEYTKKSPNSGEKN